MCAYCVPNWMCCCCCLLLSMFYMHSDWQVWVWVQILATWILLSLTACILSIDHTWHTGLCFMYSHVTQHTHVCMHTYVLVYRMATYSGSLKACGEGARGRGLSCFLTIANTFNLINSWFTTHTWTRWTFMQEECIQIWWNQTMPTFRVWEQVPDMRKESALAGTHLTKWCAH